MSIKVRTKLQSRNRRRKHIRKKVRGTPERPRLAIFRSLKHIHAQIYDDISQRSLVQVSDLSPEIRDKIKPKTTKEEKSTLVGELVARKALDQDIKKVVFDRGGYQYHGRVKALAEAARKAGLEF